MMTRFYLLSTLLLFPFLAHSQLSGTYTIGGSSPDYPTLSDAVNDLNLNGISSPVIFDIRSGTYIEQMTIEEIFGASSTNTITFQSETGSAADVTIQYDSPYDGNNYAVVRLDGTDHIRFQNLTFEPLGNNYNLIFRLSNGTSDVEISDCVFNGNNTYAIYNSYGGSCTGLSFTNNEFNNCREAISLSNNSMTDVIISDNTFNSVHTGSNYDIYCYDIDSLIIHNNTSINASGSSGIYARYVANTLEIVGNTVDIRYTGIDARNSTHVQIENNEVYNFSTNTGMYIRDNGNVARRSSIVNNVVSGQGDGMYFYNNDYADVYFNSVLTTGLSSYEAFYQRYSDNTDIRNNIFSHQGGGLAIYSYAATNLVQDYNAYHNTGSNFGNWQDTNYSNLADWQATSSQDANSINANPVYTSTTDLRPNQALIDDAGAAIAMYPLDIEGTTRSTPPDMGAYEFTATGDNSGITYTAPLTPFDPGTYPVSVDLMNNGPSILMTDSLYWEVNGVAQTPVAWAGNLNVGDSESVALGNYQFDEITEYEIRIWSSRPNGMTDIDPMDDTLVISNLYTTLAGDFTVGGASPDFADLTAAQDAVNYGGIRGAVNMLIRSGTYIERLYLWQFAGTSPTNTVTFQAETGNAADVTIQYDSPYDNNNFAMVRLQGTDNVAFQHLTFEPLGGSYNLIFRLNGSINNLDISNCIFNGNNTHAIYNSYSGACSDFNFSDNEFNNCRETIHLSSNTLNGVIITDNQINSVHTGSNYDIYCYDPDSIIIHNNQMNNPNGSSGIYARYIANTLEIVGNTVDIRYTGIDTRNAGHIQIENNQVYNFSTNTGLYVRDNGNVARRSSVVNNVVSGQGDGFYCYNNDYTDVYFNSVLTTGAANYEAFYQRYSDYSNFRNNVFSHQGGGLAIYAYSQTDLVQDYNAYYSTGSNFGNWQDTNYANLADWQAASSQDANSVVTNPVYNSADDLRPNQALLDEAGETITEHPLDIEGTTRSTPPDMGAYEFTPTGDNAGITFAEPELPLDPGTHPVSVDLLNSGPSILMTDSLYWEVNSMAQTPVAWVGNLNVGDSENVPLGNYDFEEITEYEIRIWSSRPNGASDLDPTDDTLVISNFYTTLAGQFTIGGTSPDFADLAAVQDALNYGGVRDSVRMLMRSDTFTEQLVLGQITGSSEVNKVTFSSETGNAADVLIEYNSPYDNNAFAVVRLNGTDNVCFENLTFRPFGSYNLIFRLNGSINNLDISNCIFNGNNTHAIYNSYSGSCADFRFSGNEFNNCREAISLSSNTLNGVIITDNQINSVHTSSNYEIYNYDGDSVIIHNNEINNPNGSSGIYVRYVANTLEIMGNTVDIRNTGIDARNSQYTQIENNQIYNNSTNTGLYVRDLSVAAQSSRIINNMVSSQGDGFYLYNADNTNVYFNSVLTTGAASYEAFYQRYSDNADIRNNIFSHQGGGWAMQGYTTTGLVQDYNDYHTTGATLGNWDGADAADLTAWEFATQQDGNSISLDPLFQSADDLHTNNILLAVGIPIAGVTEDIEGDERNPLSPYIGADESPTAFDDIGIVNLISPTPPFPQGTNELIINVVNNFTTPLTSATISWSMNNDTIREVNWTGNIPSGTSDDVSIGTFQFDVAQPYDLKVWVADPNGQADSYADNDTLEVDDMYAALIGTYTIGTNNADFQTITQAAEALERGGVVGDVTFNIQDGTYAENVEINQILGASVNDQILFQSESQDSTSVTIMNGVSDYGNIVIQLDSTDHIEFRHLTFEQDANSAYCMILSGTNENVNINNCRFSTSYMGIRVDNFVDNLQITENQFSGGTYGFYDNSYNNSTNLLVEDNLFTGQSSDAITIRYHIAPVIRSNDIINTGSMSRGIYMLSPRDAFEVIGNTLILNDATYGIDVSAGTASTEVHGLIGNNFVTIDGASTTYGMRLSGNYIDIFHNNILVTANEATAGRAIYLNGNFANLKNNIFANIGTGYAIYAENSNDITESDYNDFYAPGGKVGYLMGNRTSLGSWQSGSGHDANSFNLDPEFIANDDLHIAQQLLSEQGTPVDGLPEDIDGDFRNPLAPDIGADEFTSLENNLGVIDILSPTTGCDIPPNSDVTIVIKNPGSLTQSNFDVAYQLGDDTPIVETVNQSIDPGFTLEHTFATPVTLIADSTYTLAAYTLLGTDELTFNDTTSIEVISYPAVNLVVTPDATIDYGDTLTLTASGATNYEWSGELEGENPFSPTLQVAPFETQMYQVVATDDNGCEATATVTITVNPLPELPDLQVINVVSDLTTAQPGDPATVTWTIGNIGDGAAVTDWTEKVYIEAPGGQNRTLVGQFDYDGTDSLQAGAFFNRSYNLNLPNDLNIGNQGIFVVEIIPNILEIPLSTANNIAFENQAWTIESILFLTLANDQINEGNSLYCTVTRSGSTVQSQTVNITLNEPARFNASATVTISAGQAGRAFYIYSIQNSDLEGDIEIEMTASATGYTPDTEQFLLIDDEIPTLSINNLPAMIAEGEVLDFDIVTDFSSPDTLFINIISDSPDEVPLPTPVVIPPGMTTANVQVTLPDDDIAEEDEIITITAGSAGLVAANASFTLTNDEDIPAITFAITNDTISESSGFYATEGVITRLGNASSVLQVDIATDSPGALYLPSTVPLGPGEMEKRFFIGVFDNLQNEGIREIEITASVLIASCNCTASSTSAGVFSDTLTVLDNDGPTLTAFVNPLSLAEGSTNAGTLRIERNTPTDVPLTVNLTSSDETELVLPATVIIPIGASSVNVDIETVADGIVDGNQQVTIQAEATDFSPGIVFVIVTDNNKPDFEIVNVTLDDTNLAAQEPFNFRVFLTNSGLASAPSGAVIRGYISDDPILNNSDFQIGQYTTNTSIAIGDTLEIWDVGITPYEAGAYYLIFEVNPESTITEIQYQNNTSEPLTVTLEPDYFGTAIVDEAVFLQGDDIVIYGESVDEFDTPVPNVELELYVITGDNIRREFSVTTDGSGAYSTVFEPLPNEAGHYEVGASFPDMGANTAQDEFDILGIELNANQFILWEVLLNEPITGTISVRNRSDVTLNNVMAETLSLPAGASVTFDTIPAIAGGATEEFNYTVNGTEVSPIGFYQEIPLRITSDENLSYEQTAFYFCQAQQGYISAEISSINRTISQTQSNYLEFQIYNNGEGETGEITVSLPPVDFMSLITLPTMPSLESGDTSLVIIEFKPGASLPLNTPANGNIVINAANGNFLNIPYTVEKVSEETGGIIVDVVDQYTYFTEEAPHVAGAQVKISHYFTGEVFAEGVTDEDGLFMADSLPEGTLRLTVQAEQHEGYNNTVEILPGTDVTETVFLPYQAISFTWDVVPTTVEDVYEIDLIMEFETNVPAPVVLLEMPDSMPQLFGSEEYNFYATMTNFGLITARDVELNFPTDDPEYEFITNYTPTDLLAQQAIQVPVVMRRRNGGQNEEFVNDDGYNTYGDVSDFLGIEKDGFESFQSQSLSGNCQDFTFTAYWYECGDNGLWQQGGEMFTYSGRVCPGNGSGLPGGGFGPGGGSPNGCPGCPGTGPSNPNNNTPSTVTEIGCNACVNSVVFTALGCYPPTGAIGCIGGVLTSGSNTGAFFGLLGCIPKKGIGCIISIICTINSCAGGDLCSDGDGNLQLEDFLYKSSGDVPPIIQQAGDDLVQVQMAYEAHNAWMDEYFGPLADNDNVSEFAVALSPFVDNELPVSPSDANDIKAQLADFDISESEIDAFISRWNETQMAWSNGIYAPNATYPNIVNRDSIEAYIAEIQSVQDYAFNRGYASIDEMLYESIDIIVDQGESNSGVCSSVTIQISQQLTMTREAFEGTLGVFNGHPTDALQDLQLNLEILNPDGVLSNDLFQIEVTGLNNLTGVDGTGSLAAQQDGSATILFIPEPGAAPTVPVNYSFGGSVSYLDPFSGLEVTVPLIPVTLQVNPSPDLYLHYFMQRDIYGDDPLTEAIEPIIPAELAVMVENNGYGVAMGVLIESAQPEIVKNEDGLAIEFSLIGSNLQGEPANMGLTNIQFGDIAPLSTKVGQWYFTSTLLGHFISYETNLVHLSSFGNPDLSLISGVELHESIHTIEVYTQDDGVDDFLVNEIQDANETPDAIYLSQGNLIYDVFEAQDAYFTGNILAAGNTNTFHIDPSAQGWNYIKIDDPGNGNFEIVSVTRDSDGQEIPLKNAWLTHVTLPDSKEPVYEDKFHFVDDFDTFDEVTYTVVWSPKDPNPPFVVSIEGHPNQLTAMQVETLTVTFSEEIIDGTFGTEDLMLRLQGGSNLIDNSVIITEIDSVTFEVDISALTVNDGFYVFTAQAAGVEDLTGTSGEVGEQVSWTQFLSVPSVLEFTGFPENGFTNQLNTIQILFNMPINPATFTADDLEVMFGGGIQAGTFTISPLNAENTLFEVTNINSFISNDGEYELIIDMTGIESDGGTPGLAMQSETFTMDTQAPQLTNLLRFIGGGLDAQHYTGANMNFDEAIMEFDTMAISLLKDGAAQYLDPAEISIVNPTSFKVESFDQTTYPEGDYVLNVDVSQISDLAGNFGTGTETTTWTVDRTPEIAISGLGISPDMGYSLVDGVTATNVLDLSFGINQAADVIRIYQDDNGSLTLLTTLNAVPAGAVTVPLLFDTGGNTAILVEATDEDGNTVEANFDIYIDESALTADWDLAPNQVLTEHPDTLVLTFSAQLLDFSEVQNALVLLYDNNVLDASDLSIEAISLTEFELTGLSTIDDTPGTYSIGVDLTLLNKYTSGVSGNDISYATWEIEVGSNALPVADAGLDSLVTMETTYMLDATNSFDPDGDDLTFQWYPPDGITLNDETIATPSFSITAANQGQELDFLVSVSDGVAFSTDIVTVEVDLSSIPTCAMGAGLPMADAVSAGVCVTDLQGWQHFTDNMGRILFSLNTSGSDLGNVSANLYVNDMPIDYNGEYTLMERHYRISPEIAPQSMVSVRLYFTDGEYQNLTGNNSPMENELSVVRYSGTGEDDVYDPTEGGDLTFITTTLGTDFGVNYVEFQVDDFSEFWIRDTAILIPVELVSFNAINRERDVQLLWQTATEQNSDYFEVQRSRNGVDFESITKVQAAGTSSTIQNYEHIDEQPFSGNSYYRLEQFDTDGSSTYSRTVAIYRKPLGVDFNVYPNPAKDEIFIDYKDGLLGDLQCQIYNTLGQEIYKTSWTIPTNNQIMIPVSQLSDGVYFIHLRNGIHRETIEFVKY